MRTSARRLSSRSRVTEASSWRQYSIGSIRLCGPSTFNLARVSCLAKARFPPGRARARARLRADARRVRSPASWRPGWWTERPWNSCATRASSRSCSTTSTPILTARWSRRAAPRPRRPAASTPIVALGGGSSLDCAKGINFVLTNGGTMRDYRGHGKAARPMLPMIGVPTTAGTGSDAQSYAIISDPVTHEKMACGDPKAAFRIALLDPVADRLAAAHADRDRRVRCALARRRVVRHDAPQRRISDLFAARRVAAARGALRAGARRAERPRRARRHAARRARSRARHRAVDARRHARLRQPADGALRDDARRGDRGDAAARRALECRAGRGTLRRAAARRRSDAGDAPGDDWRRGSRSWRGPAGCPRRCANWACRATGLPVLAAEAATQWTGTFNPRPFDAAAAFELYEAAY